MPRRPLAGIVRPQPAYAPAQGSREFPDAERMPFSAMLRRAGRLLQYRWPAPWKHLSAAQARSSLAPGLTAGARLRRRDMRPRISWMAAPEPGPACLSDGGTLLSCIHSFSTIADPASPQERDGSEVGGELRPGGPASRQTASEGPKRREGTEARAKGLRDAAPGLEGSAACPAPPANREELSGSEDPCQGAEAEWLGR